MSALAPVQTRSTCPYCGVGCGVIIASQGDLITGVKGDPDHPANFGRLCTKGSTLHLTASEPINLHARLRQPHLRARRGEPPRPASWSQALGFAAEGFRRIIAQHGPNAVGFYLSGQLLTEDYYVFNKLAKGLIGTNNVDTNSRLCMSSAVAGYKQTLGADAPPTCYEDINHAQCVFIAGSNTAYAHPVFFRRLEEAKTKNPAMKIICVDPRRTETAEMADLFLPILPGTDVMLLNGMLHIMLWEGWTNAAYIAAHTNGFEALKATVRDCTPDAVAQVCGISKSDLALAARYFANSAATLSLYCQGLNQSSSGTAKNAALINLHLATAHIGKPGAGPFSLTGQPNAMGGREVGGLSNLLSAHRDLSNPAHRAEVAALWGVADVPSQPGKSAIEMFQAAADGEIKALWIACTNPAQSMPDQATVRRALERAELVVLQEAFSTTATAKFADVLLPATTWGEKVGTVTNSERRISRVRAAVSPPGREPGDIRTGPQHDWQIALDFATQLEASLRPGLPTLFPYARNDAALGAEQIWLEHRETTRGRDLDITGLSWALLDAAPQQWPYASGASVGHARLYEDGIFPTPDGRARFVDTPFQPVAEPRDARFPFSLNTGRLRDQWHGMSRTGTLGRLYSHASEPSVHMNPQDMARRLLKAGDLVHLTSRRGSVVLPLQADASVGVTQCFVAMHWGEEALSGRSSNGARLAGINALTTSAFCPSSKQPELKHSAVKVLKAELPWSLLAVAWLPQSLALQAHSELKALMAQFDFASCVPFASNTPLDRADDQRHGLLFRAANLTAPADVTTDATLTQIEQLLGLDHADALRYADKKRGQRRAVLLRGSRDAAKLQAFTLCGDTRSQAWVLSVLQQELDAHAYGRLLMVPGAQSPGAVAAASPQVCACVGVSEATITEFLRSCSGLAADRLQALQGALRCGTQCGSCVPQLKVLVRTQSGPMGAPLNGLPSLAAAPAAN